MVVTAYDSESGRPASNPEWGLIYYKASISAQGLPEPSPSGVVHWVPEQLNIKAVTGACKLIGNCSLALFLATVSVVSAGICHRNKVNSIAWFYRMAQPKDGIHCITSHCIALLFKSCFARSKIILTYVGHVGHKTIKFTDVHKNDETIYIGYINIGRRWSNKRRQATRPLLVSKCKRRGLP